VTRRGSYQVAIVAGEVSGDILGAGLMRALKRYPADFDFVGIGGPRMQAEGCRSLYPLESLTLMGLDGLYGRLREILAIRRRLRQRFTSQRPDVYIGVDVPDFNLVLEKHLRRAAVPVVHYVSPTVWAWRRYRVHLIRKAVDRMLVLFPFELDFYREHGIEATFVGHPMVSEIPRDPDIPALRQEFGIDPGKRVVALLPGSRHSEIQRLAQDMLGAAERLAQRYPGLQFVTTLPNAALLGEFQRLRDEFAPGVDVVANVGHSREIMACADVILLASGTAALEAAIIGRPMVVAYKVSTLTKWQVRLFAHTDIYSMPNHLAGERVVPELMQEQCTPDNLARAVGRYLDDPAEVARVTRVFQRIRESMAGDASGNAARAVAELLGIGDTLTGGEGC